MIDCFMFFNELDLLEIRLNSLAPYVERFVICESLTTHRGNPKPLYFGENKDRFKGFNITHLISDGGMTADAGKNQGDTWKRENYQREFLMNGIRDIDPETIILISDLDEIPNLKDYKNGKEGVFRQKLYYYFVNVFSGQSNWKGSIAIRKKNISTLNLLRDRRWNHRTIGDGWHFSTLGSIENIIYKIESFAHWDLDRPDVKSKISENRDKFLDPYNRPWGRRPRKCSVEVPSGPEWLLENKEKYPQLWYKV